MKRQYRNVVFWSVCIPTRLYLASVGDAAWLRLFAAVIGGRWLMGLENGNEGVFGGPVWWADERALHGVLWTAYAGTGNNSFLFADVFMGAANWVANI